MDEMNSLQPEDRGGCPKEKRDVPAFGDKMRDRARLVLRPLNRTFVNPRSRLALPA